MSSAASPPVGLTQADCVEWDESKNIDLRKLDPSFQEESESLLLCIDEEDDDDHDNMFGNNNNNNHGNQPLRWPRANDAAAAEETTKSEIDGLMDRLCHGQKSSANEFKDLKTASPCLDQENGHGVITHARKRRRRARKQQQQETRRGPEHHVLSDIYRPPRPVSSSGSSSSPTTDSEGAAGGNSALAHLLQQVTTPSHSAEPSQVSSNTTPPLGPNKKKMRRASSPTSGLAANNASAKVPPIVAPRAFPTATSATSPSAAAADEDDDFDSFDLTMDDLVQIDTMVLAATQAAGDDDILAREQSPINTKILPPPAARKRMDSPDTLWQDTCCQNQSPRQRESRASTGSEQGKDVVVFADDDDEFDSFDLTMDDFELIDSMVHAATQQAADESQKSNAAPRTFEQRKNPYATKVTNNLSAPAPAESSTSV